MKKGLAAEAQRNAERRRLFSALLCASAVSLLCLPTAAEPTAPGMPSHGWQLDDIQVAAVLTYVRNTWGAAASAVSAQSVGRARSDLASRAD